jgi:hypothetical protein
MSFGPWIEMWLLCQCADSGKHKRPTELRLTWTGLCFTVSWLGVITAEPNQALQRTAGSGVGSRLFGGSVGGWFPGGR